MGTELKAGDDHTPWSNKDERPAPAEQSQMPELVEEMQDPHYKLLAKSLSELAYDSEAEDFRKSLKEAGLNITNVSWQDTGRDHNSSVGSNISDVRLVAITQQRDGAYEAHTMPIIRLPNFEDKTVDVDLASLVVPAGNSFGEKLVPVSLKKILKKLPSWLNTPEKLKGSKSLYLPRDKQLLVSAQASIMPAPKDGKAYFATSIYNYQSYEENPAVLVIQVSNRGTSITVVENNRDKIEGLKGSGSGQMLYFNDQGQKKLYTAESRRDVMNQEGGSERIDELEGSGQAIAGTANRANQVMTIQVPLKHKRRIYNYPPGGFYLESAMPMRSTSAGGLDEAVVDVADFSLGEYVELNGLGQKLERDADLPIRVDVTYYFVTDTDELNSVESKTIADSLTALYEAGENFGSLVVADDRSRETRNFNPREQRWWGPYILPIIRPCFPTFNALPEPDGADFLESVYGENWQMAFADKESAIISAKHAVKIHEALNVADEVVEESEEEAADVETIEAPQSELELEVNEK